MTAGLEKPEKRRAQGVCVILAGKNRIRFPGRVFAIIPFM